MGGVLFGPIALIAAAGLPDLKTRQYLKHLAGEQGDASGAPKPRPGQPGPGFWD